MGTITLLPSAKVPLVYPEQSTMTTEWYRFFWNIYGFTGTGVVPVNKGGTGLDTIGDHQIIIGNANSVFEPALLRGFGISVTYDPGYVNLSIGNSGVTPGTYGAAASVGQFTVDIHGVLTFAQNVPIAISATQIVSGTIAPARISGSYPGITGVGTLTIGTWNASTIAAIYGGTGQTTYTTGDLLYASSSTTLSKLADVATGNALISGGIATAPSWGKIDLTTHVSGILPVPNGGTGQSSYTDGQLLIGNTTGNTLTKSTLTAGSGVSITNGAGAITIATSGTPVTSAPTTKTANFTVGATDTWIINNKSGSTCTVTLPSAAANTGRVLYFQNYQAQLLISASSNVVPLIGGSAGTAILADIAGDTATLVSDGSNWVMTQYTPNNVLLV